ncbi:MAG: hypothetical protein AAGA96_03890 [Verrucomicrobiota bacterium]
MKILNFIPLLFAAIAMTSYAEDQTICPIMLDSEIDEEEFVEYEGVKIYMCCTSCTTAWEDNPDYYLKVAIEEGVVPQVSDDLKAKVADVELLAQRFCPLRPETVIGPDSPSIEYNGKTIYFFKDRDIERRWQRDPDGLFAEAREAGLLPQFD